LAVGKTKKSRRERGYRSWQEMGASVCAAVLLLLDVHYGGVWENVGESGLFGVSELLTL